ncbi:MAG: hypothetical protein RJA22_918 [Verrucomicrobiota bacterium]|jgi:signal transduction histidine kinase
MVPLESSHLFAQLPAAELQQLQRITRELAFPAHGEIFKEGDPGDGVYVVKSGQVQISAVVGTGERRVFSKLGPGDFFGEMAVLDQQPRSACATAETPVTLWFIPREEMIALLTRSAGLSMTLLQAISRRLREFNQQYIREVLQAERLALIGRFASSIVHDLKNPLTIIGLAAEMSCAPHASPQARQDGMDRIHKQVERITAMVNDILDYTRGRSAAAELNPEDYAAFAQPMLEELQREVATRQVELAWTAPIPPVKLALNPPRLSRVFYNLIFNAVDEMPGGGRITVSIEIGDREVTTRIADTGEGIAPEVIEQLFEPFTTFGKARGTGLGLSICQRIVEEHGGRIWAANRPEGGAVFAFTLPRRA